MYIKAYTSIECNACKLQNIQPFSVVWVIKLNQVFKLLSGGWWSKDGGEAHSCTFWTD